MLLILTLLLLVGYLTYHLWWKRRNLPPGPMPLPVLGNFLQFGQYSSAEEAYLAWRKQYGDIFTFWYGSRPIIGVCNYDHIIENFQRQGDKFEDRPPDELLMKYCKGLHTGIINTNGTMWKTQRRFALHVLRDFGLGKDLMEKRILAECEDLMANLDEDIANGRKEHPITAEVDRAIGSVINSVLFGYRYTKENIGEFEDLKHRAHLFLQALGNPAVMMTRHNPFFYEKLPILGHYLKVAREAGLNMMALFADRIREHMKDLDGEDLDSLEATDLVVAFLKEKARLDSRDEPHYFKLEDLHGFCFDIWGAGQETTSNTLGFGIAYLIRNPDVQKKAQEELDRVVGSDRLITIADRANCNYLLAVCHEIQRLANLLPSNIIHATAEDANFEGYHLPKATAIVPLISVLLYDKKVFPDPFKFDPTRFLDQNGKVKKVKEHMPFSIGKRQCLGENMARMEIFLVVANLLNRYRLLPGEKLPDTTRSHGLTAHMKDYCCRILPRYSS